MSTVVGTRAGGATEIQERLDAVGERLADWGREADEIVNDMDAVIDALAQVYGFADWPAMAEASFDDVVDKVPTDVMEFLMEVRYLTRYLPNDGNGSSFEIDFIVSEVRKLTAPNL